MTYQMTEENHTLTNSGTMPVEIHHADALLAVLLPGAQVSVEFLPPPVSWRPAVREKYEEKIVIGAREKNHVIWGVLPNADPYCLMPAKRVGLALTRQFPMVSQVVPGVLAEPDFYLDEITP